jgi:iron complex outermembrane receptor protein
MGDWSFMGRIRYFGESENSNNNGDPLTFQTIDATTFFDLEANWNLNDNWRLTAGAQNIFDEYPPAVAREIGDYCCGRIYQSGTVTPWQGGYYYGRVQVSF